MMVKDLFVHLKKIGNAYYFANTQLTKNIETVAKYVKNNVLDIGCGRKPYESLFKYVTYTGLEVDTPMMRESSLADVFYNGKNLPFDNEVFDSVVCNQVLEHIFEPDEFLAEINRVLKTNGTLLVSVPFVWDEHEQPVDYARYTRFGLKHLMAKNSFEVVEVRVTCADVRFLCQIFNTYLYKTSLNDNMLKRLMLLKPLVLISNIFGLTTYKILPKSTDIFLDQVAVFKKTERLDT